MTPLRLDGNRLVIGVPKGTEMFRDQLLQEPNRQVVEKVAREVFGAKCQIAFEDTDAAAGDDDAPPAASGPKSDEFKGVADPYVRKALETFTGSRIIKEG